MTQENNYVAAIDLGTTKIVTILAQKEESTGKLKVLGFNSIPSHGIEKGMIQNLKETEERITCTVNEVKRQTGVDFRSVHVGIAGQHIKGRNRQASVMVESPDHQISQRDVDRLVADMHKIALDPGEKVIQVTPINFFVDEDPEPRKNPVGRIGNQLRGVFHVVSGQEAASKLIARCLDHCGLQVGDLTLEPIASAESVLNDEEKEAGVMLVDIGGGTTDLVIFKDNVVRHTAVVPYGGDNVTYDVKAMFNVLGESALTLKEKFGMALKECADSSKILTVPGINGRPPREFTEYNLADIIQSRMEEILADVQKAVTTSGKSTEMAELASMLNAGVVITGGGALLKHVSSLVKFRLGMDVRIGYPVEFLAADTPQKYNSPQFSTVLGLAKIALDRKHYSYVQPPAEQKTEDLGQTPQPEEVSQPNSVGNHIKGIFHKLTKGLSKMFDDVELKDGPM